MNPLISIVVPVYNTAGYLAETIDSVLAQTYENWELLLVDDGSTDDSAKVCKAYAEKDDRIKYLFKENGGQASARNLGIRNAKAEYISLLDSDDLWVEQKLENQIQDLEQYQPDFLYGLGYYYYPEREEPLVEYQWITGERSGEQFFHRLYHDCAVNCNTVIVKKALFESIGYFDESEELRGTEDWDLWLQFARHVKKVYGSPRRDVYYRIHEGGIHLQKARMLIGKWRVFEKYDADKMISRLERKREYRYTFRELMNHLQAEKRSNEIRATFRAFRKKDFIGWGTFNQTLIFPFLPTKAFLWWSNKVIYRIAYRLEKLSYFLFLKK